MPAVRRLLFASGRTTFRSPRASTLIDRRSTRSAEKPEHLAEADRSGLSPPVGGPLLDDSRLRRPDPRCSSHRAQIRGFRFRSAEPLEERLGHEVSRTSVSGESGGRHHRCAPAATTSHCGGGVDRQHAKDRRLPPRAPPPDTAPGAPERSNHARDQGGTPEAREKEKPQMSPRKNENGPPKRAVLLCLNQSAPGGIRTPNLLIRSQSRGVHGRPPRPLEPAACVPRGRRDDHACGHVAVSVAVRGGVVLR
ncbi:hypothetical protein ACH61_00496 [Rathayibacter tanaceti]|uniref:Uncharacterized protein n=1 Tax=Rathayibacter tanaceti TaxID=1671680 RepID=A0A166IGB6_9MICO|nr:hypothetical protein ACH61_00496 [Rathayibacter tanaceti]